MEYKSPVYRIIQVPIEKDKAQHLQSQFRGAAGDEAAL